MLEIGNEPHDHDEYCMHMSLWALTAAPLLAAAPISGGNDV